MKRWNYALAAAIAAFLLNLGSADAKKPDNSGGGGDPEPSGPLVVELSTDPGVVLDINEFADGRVEAVGGTYVRDVSISAMCWTINADDAGIQASNHPLSRVAPTGYVATHTRANGINNVGVIVGSGWEVYDSPTSYWPLLWTDKSADAVLLPVPVGWSGTATSVNDDGIVLGVIWDGTEYPFPYSLVAWKVDILRADPVEDWITFLPNVSDGTIWNMVRPKIAQSGLGVTSVFSGDGQNWRTDAYRFQLQFDGTFLSVVNGTVEPLFTDPSILSDAFGVNEAGAVAGTLSYPTEAYVMDAAGDLVTLETLPSQRFKGLLVTYRPWSAEAINNDGVSVGQIEGYYVRNDESVGVYHWKSAMWDADGALTILPNWHWSSDINDAGWIGGTTTPNGPPGVIIP